MKTIKLKKPSVIIRYLVMIATFSCLTCNPVHSAESLEIRIRVLKDISEALVTAGDAIKSITDGIAHMIKTGATGYSYAAASRDRSRMIDISARSTGLATTQNVMVVNKIDALLASPQLTEKDWADLKVALRQTLTQVNSLLENVKSDRSDLVLESAYQQLLMTLSTRSAILQKLMALPLPSTPEEKAQLAVINDSYKRLIAELRDATNQLNLYLKSKPQ